MAQGTSDHGVRACAACGFLVFAGPAGEGGPCPVCDWHDDFEQLVHPDLTYGANSGRSLRQAQAGVLLQFPARQMQHRAFARDPRWRPLRTGESPPTEDGEPSSPVCYIATPDPSDFVPYWLRGVC